MLHKTTYKPFLFYFHFIRTFIFFFFAVIVVVLFAFVISSVGLHTNCGHLNSMRRSIDSHGTATDILLLFFYNCMYLCFSLINRLKLSRKNVFKKNMLIKWRWHLCAMLVWVWQCVCVCNVHVYISWLTCHLSRSYFMWCCVLNVEISQMAEDKVWTHLDRKGNSVANVKKNNKFQ